MSKPFHEMTAAERTRFRIEENRAIEERISGKRQLKPAAFKKPIPSAKVSFWGRDVVGFSWAETFPAIACVIRDICIATNDFVGHGQIVSVLVNDAELGPLLHQIAAKDPEERSMEWWASCMMAWFSQRTTEGKNPYADAFERDETSSPYRYRLRSDQ